MLLTKEELDDQDWWNQNLVFTEKNPSDGESEKTVSVYRKILFSFSDTSYERLLSVLVGSYYVDIRTLNSEVPPNVITEDLIITRDALGKDFYFF